MTAITGNDGSISTWPAAHGGATTAGQLNLWRMRLTNTVVEVTGFTGQTVLRRNRGGLLSLEGSASGISDTAGTPGMTAIAAAGASMVLAAQSGNTFTFTGLISGFAFESNKRDNTAQITFDFVGGDANDFAEAWT